MRNHNLWFLLRIAIRRWMIKAIIKKMKRRIDEKERH